MAGQSPDRLLAGEVGKPHGLSGEVYVVPISDEPSRFRAGSTLEREDGSSLTITSSHVHGNRLLVRFEGIADRNAAEGLRGPLYIGSEQVRELEEGEYWLHDLTGSAVMVGDEEVGVVEELVPGAAQDLLRVRTSKGDRFVPFVAEIVLSVDTQAKRIVIDPPEGLLD
jgi:16S rRNA processing protein RimM